MKKIILIIAIILVYFEQSKAQTCPANYTSVPAFYTNGALVPLSTISNTFSCEQVINDITIDCGPTSTIFIRSGGIYDASNNLVSWSPVFICNTYPNSNSLGNGGTFTFPTNVNGIFYIKYQWGTATQVCGTLTYPITLSCSGSGGTIPCANCTLVGSLVVTPAESTITNFSCGMHIPLTCGSTIDGSIRQLCNNVATPFPGNGVLRKQPGNIFLTTVPPIIGAYTFTSAGTYTLTYPKSSASGSVCSDSCTIYFDVTGNCTGCAPWLGKGIVVFNAANPLDESDTDDLDTPCGSTINANLNDSILIMGARDCIIPGAPQTNFLKITSPNGQPITTTFVPNPNDPDNPTGAILSIFKATLCGTYKIEMYNKCRVTFCDTCKYTLNVSCNSCPPPTIGTSLVNLGGHCGIKDTIKNPCNKNIVSWTLTVNGSPYNGGGLYPLTPQAIGANAIVITGTKMLINQPNGIIPLVYTFTYADGSTSTVTKQFDMRTCTPAPCPTCTITSIATSGNETINLNSSTNQNPVTLTCNKNYTLNNTVTCIPSAAYPLNIPPTFYKAIVTDNWNQTWPVTVNTTGTQLMLPNNMPSNRSYNLALTWYILGVQRDTCFTGKVYPFKVNCSPCGTSCLPTINVRKNGVTQFTLDASGNYSNNFSCNSIYHFIPNLNCTPALSTIAIRQIKVFDVNDNPIINPPVWLQNFVAQNGMGSLNIPTGINGIYKIKYYFGIDVNNICDSFRVIMNIGCNPCPTCTFNITLNGSGTPLSSTTPNNLDCGMRYDIYKSHACSPAVPYIPNKKAFLDATGNVPAWFNSVAFSNNALIIPPNTTGTYTLRYYWGATAASPICDSISYEIKLNCTPPACTPCTNYNGSVSINGTNTSIVNGTRIAIDCAVSFDGTIKKVCNQVSSVISNFVVKKLPSNTTIATITNGFTYTFTTAGSYSVTHYNYGTNGAICDSMVVYFDVKCVPCGNWIYNGVFVQNEAPPQGTIILPCGTSKNTTLGNYIISMAARFCDSADRRNPQNILASVRSVIINPSGQVVSNKVFRDYDGYDSVTATICGQYKILHISTCGNRICDTCTYYVNVPCTNCNFTANAGPDQTICRGTSTPIGTTILAPNGEAYSWTSSSSSNIPNTIRPTVSPTVTTTYYLEVTKPGCPTKRDTVKVTVNNCQQATCIPCTATLTSLKRDTLVPYQGITSLVEAFTFANLPANIKEVKATVTNFTFSYVDANGRINDECAICNTNYASWASVFGGEKIDGVKPTVNINGVETTGPVTLPQIVPNKNPRQATWSNNGAVLNVPNTIKVGFILPAKSTLSCCTVKANICIKFVFRNDKCEECIVSKCFDVIIDK